MESGVGRVVRTADGETDGIAAYDLLFESIRQFQSDFAPMLSTEGLFVQTDEPLEPSTVLRFRVVLPDDFVLIEGSGVVVWTRTAEDTGPPPLGMAIRFASLSERSRELIEKIVEAHTAEGGRAFAVDDAAEAELPEPATPPRKPAPPAAKPASAAAKKKEEIRFSVRGASKGEEQPKAPPAPAAPSETPPVPPVAPSARPEQPAAAAPPAPQPSAPPEPEEVTASELDFEAAPQSTEDRAAGHDFYAQLAAHHESSEVAPELEGAEELSLDAELPGDESAADQEAAGEPSTPASDVEELVPQAHDLDEAPAQSGTLWDPPEETPAAEADSLWGTPDEESANEAGDLWQAPGEEPAETLEEPSSSDGETSAGDLSEAEPETVEGRPSTQAAAGAEVEELPEFPRFELPETSPPESELEQRGRELAARFEAPASPPSPAGDTEFGTVMAGRDPRGPDGEGGARAIGAAAGGGAADGSREFDVSLFDDNGGEDHTPRLEGGGPEPPVSVEAAAPARRRSALVWLVPLLLVVAFGVAGVYFGPGLYQQFLGPGAEEEPQAAVMREDEGGSEAEPAAGESERAEEPQSAAAVVDDGPESSPAQTQAGESAASGRESEPPTTTAVSEPVAGGQREVAPGPASSVLDVGWEAGASGTTVVIVGDAAFHEQWISTFPMAEPPRVLVRVRKIGAGYPREVVEVGSPEISRIRIGHHPEQNPPALYVVLDLADPEAKVLDTRINRDVLRVTVGR